MPTNLTGLGEAAGLLTAVTALLGTIYGFVRWLTHKIEAPHLQIESMQKGMIDDLDGKLKRAIEDGHTNALANKLALDIISRQTARTRRYAK